MAPPWNKTIAQGQTSRELEPLRQELRESVALAVRLEGEGNTIEQLKIDDIEAGNAGMELQAKVVASFFFVADAGAFETEKSRLLYLDTRGNIVRETRVKCTEAWEMRDLWNGKKFRDSAFWHDRHRSEWSVPSDPGSVIGKKYKFSGEIGRALYKLD
ncbi:hypothetical protein Daesc_007278 [Daldinia eschscholtzii]|uniref:Uncharacterized protein n=1 Tax=Daldinia eschscholtzii TaxID=292717 RepID=A0AAX6ME82_9PEZI